MRSDGIGHDTLICAALIGVILGSASTAQAQPLAYVLGDRTANGLVIVIDTATGAKVTSIPVPSNGGGSSTDVMAVSPDGSRVYLVDPLNDAIVVLDTTSHAVVGSFPTASDPRTIVVSPDGSRLYVGTSTGVPFQASIRVISTATGALLGAVPLNTHFTQGIAISADGRRLYATAWSGSCTDNALKVVDTAAGSVVASIPVAPFPVALTLTPDGTAAYIAHLGSSCTTGTGTVSVLNTVTNTAVTSIPVAVNPRGIAASPDGQRVFVAHNGLPFSVGIISRVTNTVTGSIPGREHMRAIAFTPDGRRALAPWDAGLALFDATTNWYAGSVAIDPATEGTPRAVVVLPLPPDPPTNLFSASIVGNRVTLLWQPPAAGPSPTSYALEGGTAPGEVLAILPTGSVLPTISVTAPTGVFYVRVRALVGAMRSAVSNEIRIAVSPPHPPATPEGLVGLVNGSSIALAWRNSPDGGGASATLLDVAGAITAQLTLPPTDSFTFDGVPPGTYTLAVRRTNAFGISAPSNTVTLSFPGPCSGVPIAPESFRVYKVGTRLYLYWLPAATGPAPTGYVLNVTGTFTGSVPTTARTLDGAVGPGTYVLSMTATNACGPGPATTPHTVTVP